jgi:hypothetical protein
LQALSSNKKFEFYCKEHYVQAVGIDVEKQLFLRHFNMFIRKFPSDFFQLHKYLLTGGKTKSQVYLNYARLHKLNYTTDRVNTINPYYNSYSIQT